MYFYIDKDSQAVLGKVYFDKGEREKVIQAPKGTYYTRDKKDTLNGNSTNYIKREFKEGATISLP